MTTIDDLELAGATGGNPVIIKELMPGLIKAVGRFANGERGARNSVIAHVAVLGEHVPDLKNLKLPALNGKTIGDAIWPK